jgi:hypothetical protein
MKKIYFIIRGVNVIFFEYLGTLLIVLVAVQSFVNSQVVGGLCFFHVVGPRLAYLKLHIVFIEVLQFLLLITHKR